MFLSNQRRGLTALMSFAVAVALIPALSSCATPLPPTESEPAPSAVKDLPDNEAIVGQWQTFSPSNQDALVDFGADGLYVATDGCNSTGGGWQLSTDGTFLASSIGITQVGCNNEPIPEAVFGAVRAKVDGDTLELTDSTHTTTRLKRIGKSELSLLAAWQQQGSPQQSDTITFAADGTWKGESRAGSCSVRHGTWQIEFAAEGTEHQIVDTFGTFGKAGTYMTPQGAPILSIGPVPADPAASCIENTDPVALKYATKYELWLGADWLSILPLSSVAIEQDLVRFANMQG